MIAFAEVRWWRYQRRGWSFHETIRRHTMLKDDNARARRIKALPWRPLPEQLGWMRLLTRIWQWSQGWHEDPCPGAITWHGREPTERARKWVGERRLVRLECGTVNVPYALAGRAGGEA